MYQEPDPNTVCTCGTHIGPPGDRHLCPVHRDLIETPIGEIQHEDMTVDWFGRSDFPMLLKAYLKSRQTVDWYLSNGHLIDDLSWNAQDAANAESSRAIDRMWSFREIVSECFAYGRQEWYLTGDDADEYAESWWVAFCQIGTQAFLVEDEEDWVFETPEDREYPGFVRRLVSMIGWAGPRKRRVPKKPPPKRFSKEWWDQHPDPHAEFEDQYYRDDW